MSDAITVSYRRQAVTDSPDLQRHAEVLFYAPRQCSCTSCLLLAIVRHFYSKMFIWL